MSEVLEAIRGELVEEREFFAPASTDLVDSLIGQYKTVRADIEGLAALIQSHDASVHYFLIGNRSDRDRSMRSVSDLFGLDGAIAVLNSDYWSKALKLTDVYEYMPNERRAQWEEQIENPQGIKAQRLASYAIEQGESQKEWRLEPLPDFEDETVRATLVDMLNSRQKFFAERVDGIFRNLSGEHVTNQPQGFSKRMIMSRIFNDYGYTNHSMAGYISDLRQVIAKFMGRDAPSWHSTDAMLTAAFKRHGQWMTVDGGAMRIRCYLKGTSHLEIHPDMAWRLNAILANMYPLAIPPEFRQKPTRKLKEFVLMTKPLPFAVIDDLLKMTVKRHTPYQRERWEAPREPITTNPFNREFNYGSHDKAVRAESERVLEAIGGVRLSNGSSSWYEFDYEPSTALADIIASGCLPDKKAFQFYPTPLKLAEIAVDLADIGPDDICLEPSAGIGNIADLMPKARTICVEISKLHCTILESKGYTVQTMDFIEYTDTQKYPYFDRIIMNPPFSEGRAQSHLEAAYSLVKEGGILVAILPAGMRGKTVLKSCDLNWSPIYNDEFQGTSISVVILKVQKPITTKFNEKL
jgi:hypothetical protein